MLALVGLRTFFFWCEEKRRKIINNNPKYRRRNKSSKRCKRGNKSILFQKKAIRSESMNVWFMHFSGSVYFLSLSFGLRFNKRLRFGAFVTRLNIYTLDFSAVLTASKRPFSPGIDLMANETEWMLWLCFFFLYSHLISYIYYYFCWWLVIACVAYFMRFDYRQLNYLNWFGFNSKLNCIQCLCFFCFEFFVKIHKIK